jgi:hypothetical protein
MPMLMKSVLPPDLESKRLKIARTHNRLVLFMLLGIFVVLLLLIGIAPKGPRGRPFLVSGVATLVILEGYAIYRIFKYDKQLCVQLDFICPHCHQPLYEPRGFINITGRCPKCKKPIP